MNQKTIRLIGVLFVIICIASGAMFVAHAQENTQSINASYDYSDSEVDYELSGSFTNEWDIETLYTNQTHSFTSGGPIGDFEWAQSGNTLIVFKRGSGEMERYSTSNPYDISNLQLEESVNTEQIGVASGVSAFTFSSSGDMFYVTTFIKGTYQYQVDDPYNLSTIQSGTEESMTLNPFLVKTDVAFSPDGQILYHSGANSVYRTPLSTPWDITTDLSTTSYEFSLQNVESIRFRNEETMYLANDSEVIKYSIPDPSSIQETTIENSNDFNGGQIDWSDNGEFMFGLSGATLERYQTNAFFTVRLIDSTGTTIDGTESTTLERSGSIGYSATDYEEIRVAWENTGDSSQSVISDPIGVYGNGEMQVREEQTNDIVTQDVNVTAYGEDSGIYSLDTSDGTIDITGLPIQAYTFTTDATNYTLRNKYVENLGNKKTLYLLENNTDRITSQFVLEDTTNTFTSNARLIIERSVEDNGNDWEEIYSDSFGVEGVTMTLQEGVRYRISVENDDIRRTIGPYRATVSEQITISPTSGDIGTEAEGSWSMGAHYDSDHIDVRYTDPEDSADSVSITIYERGNESNVLIDEDTYVTPRDLRAEYQVPAQYNESNWIVSLTTNRNGESTTVSMQVGPTLDTVPANLDPMWQNIISVIVIFTFGLAFSALNRAVGAIVLALVGGALWWVGWLAGATAGVLITAYLFIAIGYGIYAKSAR